MEYGKFNSAEELLKGYVELEKSFTQKCQRLSELEKQIENSGTSEQSSPQQDTVAQSTAGGAVDSVPTPTDADSSTEINHSATQPNDQLRQYLAAHPEIVKELLKLDESDSLSNGEQRVLPPKVMTGGGNVSMALPNRPKTIKEASDLAKHFFK